MKITVLLSTYNGEKYLREQLDSLVNQSLRPNKILIRDDDSTDDTLKILSEYAKKYNFISFYQGQNLKTTKSFWDLIKISEESDYYALCDQDDVWLKDKLESAINLLSNKDNNTPLLYCSKYTLTDSYLNPLNSKVSKLYNYTDFPHSLMYHTAPGCTFVFNQKAREQILKYDLDKEYYVIHDAIIHKAVALFGEVVLDETSHILYRQHSNNQIGMSSGAFNTLKVRINNFVSGKLKNYRSNSAKSLLNVYKNEITDEDRKLLELVANYRKSLKCKFELLNTKSIKTNSINDLLLDLLIILNYV